MKSLFLVSLALSAVSFLSSYANASDIAFCTLGGPSNDVQTFSAGDRKYGSICTIGEGETLQFDGKTTPQTAGNAATVELTYSNVGARGLVWIVGPESESIAANTVPYIVNINSVIFSQDAMIAIQGSFGKGSDISISSCTFNIVQPQGPFAATGAFGIMIFENIGVQRFYDNSRLRLTSNTITMTNVPSNVTAFGIGVVSQLKLDAGSSVEITKNTVRLRNTAAGAKGAFGMAFTGTVVPQGNGAKFLLASNTFDTQFATPLYLPEVASPTFTFTYNITQNTVQATPAYATSGSAVAALLRPISLGGESVLGFTKNIITATGSDALVMTTSISLNDNAAAFYTNNDIFSIGGSPAFGIQGTLNIPSTGELVMDFNKLRRNDTTAATLPPFYFGGSIQLQGIALLSISHNEFDALNKDAKQVFLGKSGTDAINKGSNANFYVCNNLHYTEQIDSQSMRLLYISDGIRPSVNDASTCGARATTTAPTTTTTTTPTSTTTTTTTTIPTPNTGGTRATLPVIRTTMSSTTLTNTQATTTIAANTEEPLDNGASLSFPKVGSVLMTIVLMGYAVMAGF